MRQAKDTDFFIELPGVGVFRFGRRTFLDRAKIRAEFLRITKELGDDDAELSAYSMIMAAHKVICVEAPSGWEDIESIELTIEKDKQIFALYDLVRKKEDLFRIGASEGGEESGQGIVDDVPVLVSPEVQPTTE